jgi:hypothetical protein
MSVSHFTFMQEFEQTIIVKMQRLYSRAPDLAADIRKPLPEMVTWVALALGIINVLLGLLAIGLSPIVSFISDEFGWYALLNACIILLTGTLLLLAFPKLNNRQYAGWRLLFLVVILRFLPKVVLFDLFTIVLNAVGAGIVLYILFQVKPAFGKQ